MTVSSGERWEAPLFCRQKKITEFFPDTTVPVKGCHYYLGNFVEIRFHLYCLRSMPLVALSSHVISVFDFRVLHIASSNCNCFVIALYVSLCHCVTYS